MSTIERIETKMIETTRRSLLAGAALLPFSACAPQESEDPMTTPTDRSTPSADRPDRTGRPLLAHFSRDGENYYYGDRIDLDVGNTAVVARIIADLIDVDLHEIKAADPYPDSYDATVERNQQEQDADARPAIAGHLPDLERYDTVILGSGLWNVRLPMIMRTFVESFDFTDRNILPLVTYAISGLGQAPDEYADL